MDWIYGTIGSGLIAGAAYWKGALSKSGAVAAVVVGTALYASGGLLWAGLMIGFFVSSTLLTKWKQHKKQAAETVYQKSGRRDAGQVMANGGIGTLLCLVHSLLPDADWPLFAYIGVMATVTADTWATEVGGLSGKPPRSILTWRTVPKGTSGGVSVLGWGAAAGGGAFIGVMAAVMRNEDPALIARTQEAGGWLLVGAALLAGWVGANADSLMGASVQALYRCGDCGRTVEARLHCNRLTVQVRGLRWMDNDAVNAVSSIIGGAAGVVLLSLWPV